MKAKFYWGKTGSGKTLGVTKDVLIDAILGREIWGNMTFYDIPFNKIDMLDLIDMVINEQSDINSNTPKTLVLDEIQTLFDGRKSMTKDNQTLSLFISQCRKRGFNVYYTSQYISGADLRMRAVTDYLIRCIPIKNTLNIGLGDISNPEPIRFEYRIMNIQTEQLRRKYIPRWFARMLYKYYNTYEVIRPMESYT